MKHFKKGFLKWFSISSLICISLTSEAASLKILAYNTWGVPFTAWDTWRYEAAMIAIEAMDPDVVVLSEVFTPKGRCEFKSKKYPYWVNGPRSGSRLVGSGLRILSKFPIDQFAILKYRACKGSDCFSRKGATLVTLALPENKKVNIVGTHLDASSRAARLSQLKQLQAFSEWYEDPTAPTVIAGDLNFSPNTPEYQFTTQNLSGIDAWVEIHGSNDPGYTYDCELNPYAREYSRRTNEKMIRKRLDYLFHRGPIQIQRAEITFNQKENLFSDHFGLLGEYTL